MRFALAVLAALALTPFTLAHKPPGLKGYCEPSEEWHTHDYDLFSVNGDEDIPPDGRGKRAGLAVSVPDRIPTTLAVDGNVLGDCSGRTSVDPGTPCAGFEDPAKPLTVFAGLCDAEIDPPLADWDGHDEFAVGGAVLLVDSVQSMLCYGAQAHHPLHGPFSVTDTVLGANATFTVAADTVDLLGLSGSCGDLQLDASAGCVGTCVVTFLAGLDGAYVVHVRGTSGHVVS